MFCFVGHSSAGGLGKTPATDKQFFLDFLSKRNHLDISKYTESAVFLLCNSQKQNERNAVYKAV